MTTDEEVRAIVRTAVRETLISLGVDPDDHHEVQRDMIFLRSWRESTAAVKRQGLMTAIGVVVVGFLGLMWAIFLRGMP